MPLQLYAPGTRKNKKYWIARGRENGRRVEYSTQATTKAAAQAWLRQHEQELAAAPQGAVPPPPPSLPAPIRLDPTIAATALDPGAKTMRDAVLAYAEYRDLDLDNPRAYRQGGRMEIRRLKRLIAELGAKPVAAVVRHDLVQVANKHFPSAAAATRNRDVIVPGRAVLHYAAEQQWRSHTAIAAFEEPKPVTRAVSIDAETKLLAATPAGKRRLLVLWLFRQGTRITETLNMRWRDGSSGIGIDLDERVVRLRVKGGRLKTYALADEIVAELEQIPAGERTGKLFGWGSRQNVYRWLKPLAAAQGVHFTPHQARHTVGTRLNAMGAGLRTIMDVLGHDDVKSSLRYQSAGIEVSRAAINGLSTTSPQEPAPGLNRGPMTAAAATDDAAA